MCHCACTLTDAVSRKRRLEQSQGLLWFVGNSYLMCCVHPPAHSSHLCHLAKATCIHTDNILLENRQTLPWNFSCPAYHREFVATTFLSWSLLFCSLLFCVQCISAFTDECVFANEALLLACGNSGISRPLAFTIPGAGLNCHVSPQTDRCSLLRAESNIHIPCLLHLTFNPLPGWPERLRAWQHYESLWEIKALPVEPQMSPSEEVYNREAEKATAWKPGSSFQYAMNHRFCKNLIMLTFLWGCLCA